VKTTVEIPDALFREAKATAAREGLPRLYASMRGLWLAAVSTLMRLEHCIEFLGSPYNLIIFSDLIFLSAFRVSKISFALSTTAE
jgi:hypothetical protein